MNSWVLAWECIVFILFVVASTCVPLWKRKQDAKAGKSAKRAYIFAAGGVSTLSMILSVSRAMLGVRSVLGFPSELVYYGSSMWETLYGMALAFPLICWIFIPVYYRLQTNSVYEYLQMRFGSNWVRRIASATFILRQTLTLAVTVYTPTVVIHAIVGLPHWVSAAALTAVTIVFNLLGGLAAAIRADVIQTLTMVMISGAFIIQATVKAGGPRQVIEENLAGGRLDFINFTWDPAVRVDTLSALFGQLFMSLSIYGCQQNLVQRYCSMSSEARVKRTLLVNIPAMCFLFSISWVVGMTIYALYKYCDPLISGRIIAPDEVLPFYVLDQFSFLPGMVGFFTGSIFNGTLRWVRGWFRFTNKADRWRCSRYLGYLSITTTKRLDRFESKGQRLLGPLVIIYLVSNVNSVATVTWEDFISAIPAFKNTGDKQQLVAIKTIGVIFALTIMCLSLCVGLVGGVIEGSLLVTSATSGALVGVFLLAALFPMANGKGAIFGMMMSHIITIWMAIGRLMYVNSTVAMLDLSVERCDNTTPRVIRPHLMTPVNQTRAFDQHTPIFDALMKMYSLSYMWYAVIGTFTCITIGIIIGYITGNENDIFDEKLLHPIVAKICRKFPGKKRTYVTEDKKEEKVTEKIDNNITFEEPKSNSTFSADESTASEVNETPRSPSKTRL